MEHARNQIGQKICQRACREMSFTSWCRISLGFPTEVALRDPQTKDLQTIVFIIPGQKDSVSIIFNDTANGNITELHQMRKTYKDILEIRQGGTCDNE